MIAAIVLAGGSGKRMQSEVPKQYQLLQGKPLISYALQAFEESEVDEVTLVVPYGEEERCRQEIVHAFGFQKVVRVVAGGRERYESVYLGLKAIHEAERIADIVLIHDGARPLITPAIINHVIDETREYEACVTGMPVKDTIQMTDENDVVTFTPKRESLWLAQTPQAFTFSIVYDAYERLMKDGETAVTDDASVVGLYHTVKIHMVRGSYRNIKITTPEDLVIAEALRRE